MRKKEKETERWGWFTERWEWKYTHRKRERESSFPSLSLADRSVVKYHLAKIWLKIALDKRDMGKNVRPGVRRKAERVKAEYDIRQGAVVRREMGEEEVRELFIAIDQNILSKFGIVKLSTILLDSSHPAPHPLRSTEFKNSLENSLENIHLSESQSESSSSSHLLPPSLSQYTTLLNYSAWMRRDQITYALLRAGANPMSRIPLISEVDAPVIFEPEDKRTLSEIFERFPSCYSVWVLWKLSQLRQRGNELVETAKKEETCCPLLFLYPLFWDSCKHLCCEHCLWKLVMERQHSEEGGFICHLCFRRSLGDEIDIEEADLSKEREDEPSSMKSVQRKKRSLLLFQSLPLDSDASQSSLPKKPKFRALSLLQVKESYLGIVQSTRTNEFLRAAIAGDVLRLRMLIFHGVDVDARNEYGETALILAVYHNKPNVVRLLVEWASADMTIPTFSGFFPLTLAISSPDLSNVCLPYFHI